MGDPDPADGGTSRVAIRKGSGRLQPSRETVALLLLWQRMVFVEKDLKVLSTRDTGEEFSLPYDSR